MTVVCPIHTNTELTPLGSCTKCRKRVQGIPKPEPKPEPSAAPIAVPAPAPKSAAAIRADRWRQKQKQQNPNFNKEQAERKQTERKETKGEQQLQKALDSGQFPKSLSALRLKEGPKLVLTDAPQGMGLIVTGGYNGAKIDIVTGQHLSSLGGLYQGVSLGRPNRPAGAGPAKETTVAEEMNAGETIVESKQEHASRYIYIPPKDVRVMRDFIRGCTDTGSTDGMSTMTCLLCPLVAGDDGKNMHVQICPDFSFAAGFNHLYEKHPERFEQMMQRVVATQKRRRCTDEDHHGMAKRHGHGTRKIYCGRCKKLLYKPPKPGRSDKPEKQSNTFKVFITKEDIAA